MPWQPGWRQVKGLHNAEPFYHPHDACRDTTEFGGLFIPHQHNKELLK
jgi:hypothetical protein